MCELEFSSQSGGLVHTTVVLVENLQRYRMIRIAASVRPVHGGVPTTSESRLDDIAREVVADQKHV